MLAALVAMPAHAAVIATANRKDGAVVRLTDQMQPACNQAAFHGAATITRAGKAQQACWAFDWKTRVFLVVPLVPRTLTEGVLHGVTRMLDGESAAAWREIQPRDTLDEAHSLRMRAADFKWAAKPPKASG